MSWATWTGAFDTDNQNPSGSATRKGSFAVPGMADPTIHKGSILPVTKAEGEEEPKFMWSEGYNDGETPASMVVKTQKEEEGESTEKVDYDESPQPSPSPIGRIVALPRTSFAQMPESPRRASLAPPSPLGPRALGSIAGSATGSVGGGSMHGVRRKSSTGILLDLPARRTKSISIEEPILPSLVGRRRSSVQSGATPPSPSGSSRRGSTHPSLPTLPPVVYHATTNTPARRKSSGLLHVTLPETEAEPDTVTGMIGRDGLSPPLEDAEIEDKDDPFFLPPPRPFLNNPFPMPTDPGLLSAPIMIKSSSQNSGITIRSTSSSTTASFMPILHHTHLYEPTTPGDGGGSSGIRTPSLSVQKPDLLSQPADPEHPTSILEQAFTASSQQRAKQSIGLEGIVQWHEGRADLFREIEEMMMNVGKGGVVDVEACGPRSLLDKTKDVVKDLSDVKAVWNGETKVVYHAETFGW